MRRGFSMQYVFPSLAMIMAIVAISGCRMQPAPEGITLLISGDTQGWITPCGCAANQSGGLARRAHLYEQLTDGRRTIALDAGGTAIGTGPYQTLKLRSLLEGMQAMGLAVHNIGESESDFSPEQLQTLSEQTGVTWLSANCHPAEGEHDIVSAHLVDWGELTIAITGIVAPDRVRNDDWRVADGVQAVLDVIDKSAADVTIVLAYYDETGLRELAEQLPEVDFIIGGPTGQSMPAARLGPVSVLSVTNKGKFVAKIDLAQDAAGGKPNESIEIIEIKSELTENEDQIRNLATYHDRLKAEDFSAEVAQISRSGSSTHAQSGFAIAGSKSCLACHQLDDQLWHSSKHAHAWQVLEEKNSQYDPHCQQCHTTGYGLAGGFVNVAQSLQRVNVGCENCHGPSQAHVDNPRKRTPFEAKEQCIRCHDHENSPTFEMASYWQKIIHGKNQQPIPGLDFPAAGGIENSE